MPQGRVVEIPMVGSVEFPDSMTDDQVNAACAKLYQEAKISPVSSHQAKPDLPTLDEFGRDVLHESPESMAAAKPFIAPALSGVAGAMTGGGTTLAQIMASMGAQGAAGAAGSAINGGSPMEIAGNAALDAGTAGVAGLLAKGAGLAARAAKPIVNLTTKAVTPGPAAGRLADALKSPLAAVAGHYTPTGFATPYVAGKVIEQFPNATNKAILTGAKTVQRAAPTLPPISELVRALLLAKLAPQGKAQ